MSEENRLFVNSAKMNARCSIFKLVLFHMLVAWCGAMHVPRIDIVGTLEGEVQDSIRNFVHNGKSYFAFNINDSHSLFIILNFT